VVLANCFYFIGATPSPFVYISSIVMYGVAYFFLLPFVLGLAVQFDREGRVTVINSMMPWVAHIVSPVVGSAVLAHGSFAAMGAISAGTMLVATAFVVAAGSQSSLVPANAAAGR
jgi:hypothetical protein